MKNEDVRRYDRLSFLLSRSERLIYTISRSLD